MLISFIRSFVNNIYIYKKIAQTKEIFEKI